MYQEQENTLIELGASKDGIEAAFIKLVYKEPVFVEYLIKRAKQAHPKDLDAWLKISLKWVYKTYCKEKKIPVVVGRKTRGEKISDTKKRKHKLETSINEVSELKYKWEHLENCEKEQYYKKVKDEKGDLPPAMLNFFAFNLFVQGVEKFIIRGKPL